MAPTTFRTQATVKEFETPLLLTTRTCAATGSRTPSTCSQGTAASMGSRRTRTAPIDGDYGPATAAATKSAKFWVGLPVGVCDRVFGQTLYEYLRPNEWRPLPDAYRARREQRIAAATKTPGMKALAFAVNEIGNHETPYGSNRSKYGAWYGFNGVPWCAIFESYCFGATRPPVVQIRRLLEQIYSDAHAGRNGLRESGRRCQVTSASSTSTATRSRTRRSSNGGSTSGRIVLRRRRQHRPDEHLERRRRDAAATVEGDGLPLRRAKHDLSGVFARFDGIDGVLSSRNEIFERQNNLLAEILAELRTPTPEGDHRD
jgi:hypothetical protein